MDIIYEPTGPAREYSPLAVNVFKGCTHGCRYCYGPSATYRKREDFHREDTLKENALKRLAKDAGKLRGDDRVVHFCFIGDLYNPSSDGISRDALQLMVDNNLRFTVLTKGGTRAVRDFDLMEVYGMCGFGTSLVFTNQEDADYWEPNAASVDDRIDAIEEAHSRGIKTWVSLEPVIDPKQALEVIERLHPVVDHWKVGKINHRKEIERKVDWVGFRADVTALLDSVNANYYIKLSLRGL
jgi:DNA repair photolyase